MNDEKYQRYTINTIALLIELARKAKTDASNSNEHSKSYFSGITIGYYSIITLLKNQAFIFCLDLKKLGLADIKPDVDLLGLHRNPDADFGNENWTIDEMNEEKVKTYLSESVKSLKDQAIEAKKNINQSKESCSDYNKGEMMAYHSTFSLLKHQAFVFDIDEKELGLTDIDMEIT